MSEQDFKKVARKNNPQDLIEELVIIAEILQDSNTMLRKESLKIPFLKQAIKELQHELSRTSKKQLFKPRDVDEQARTELKPLSFVTQYNGHKRTSSAVAAEVSKNKVTNLN